MTSKRIILHWTAGTGQPCNTDIEHYHFLVNVDGIVIEGKYKPQDNDNCADGKYAAHTGGGNTGSIGVSMCGMYGYKSPTSVGKYPLTKVQCERTFSLIASLCKKYGIVVNPQNVMTHYEFGQRHPKTSSAGKIDIVYLPPYPSVQRYEVGDFIRNKVRWYLSRL